MLIKKCIGYELEKEKPNTSEDFFNRSEVTFVDRGEEKTFHLLYVRYFDELISECTPFNEDPLFTAGEREIYFKDIVGLVFLLAFPQYKARKRVYINTIDDFKKPFKQMDVEKLQAVFEKLEQTGEAEFDEMLASPK